MKSFLAKLFIAICFFAAASIFAESKIDLTELSFKNPSQPYANIVTGGQPSKADLEKLKDLGIKNIVNLRTAGEFDKFNEAVEAKKLGLNYLSLEVAGASGVTLENAQKLDALLKNISGNTLVHCASSNRVGALFAIRAAAIQSKSVEQAMLEGKKAGLKSLTGKTEALLIELNK